MDVGSCLDGFPLVAILRGVRPDEVEGVGDALVRHGFRIIEVPLNSPEPFESIRRLVRRFPDVMVGAGTVLDPDDADRVIAGLGETGTRIVTRLAAFLLLCVGVQIMSSGVAQMLSGQMLSGQMLGSVMDALRAAR